MFIAVIISGCESWPETLLFETTISDLGSTFKFTKAERFSYKYAVGDYYAYTDTIVIFGSAFHQTLTDAQLGDLIFLC
jgi:hypothetical protein